MAAIAQYHQTTFRTDPVDVRGVIEYERPDRCIVWEAAGRDAFCAFVTADHCPCEMFATDGDCAHIRKAREILSTERNRV